MSMRPLLLLPLRSLSGGKSRLAGLLDGSARRRLNTRFLDHLLGEANAWPGLADTVVVSACDEVLAHASRAGARTFRQVPAPASEEATSRALNAGLEQARRAFAGEHVSRALMVASCDLPLASADDLRRMAASASCGGGRRSIVIVPDRAGTGTNALFLPAGAALPFRFGCESAANHVAAACHIRWSAVLLSVPGLAFDIDTPADYVRWRQLEEVIS